MPVATPAPFDVLRGNQYVNLTTYRANGDAVSTPVWFSLAGGVVRIASQDHAGKVRRILRNRNVTIEPATVGGKPLGPAVFGNASIVTPAEFDVMRDVMAAKYGLQWTLFTAGLRLAGRRLTFLEIRPSDGSAA